MSVLIEAPPLPDELIALIDDVDARFELALHDGDELGRGPLWIPYWPTRRGQRVSTSEPTEIQATEDWLVREWSVWCKEEQLLRRPFVRPAPMHEGERIRLNLTIDAA